MDEAPVTASAASQGKRVRRLDVAVGSHAVTPDRAWRLASLILRGTIAAAFLFALVGPSLPQLQDPATHAREIAWPIGLLLPPTVLFVCNRGGPYPWKVDALLALPFALDAVGNVLNLYHRWDQYDTMNHFVSWFALAALASTLAPLRRLPPWAHAGLALGAGALGAVAWELGEYAAFIHSSDYTRIAYTDTLSDLAAGTAGASLAAALVLLERRHAQAESVDSTADSTAPASGPAPSPLAQ